MEKSQKFLFHLSKKERSFYRILTGIWSHESLERLDVSMLSSKQLLFLGQLVQVHFNRDMNLESKNSIYNELSQLKYLNVSAAKKNKFISTILIMFLKNFRKKYKGFIVFTSFEF